MLALSTAGDSSDRLRLAEYAARLEQSQRPDGGWAFDVEEPVNTSLSQLVLMALREAARDGIGVRRETWRRAADYWRGIQQNDGGWQVAGSADWVDIFGVPDKQGRARAALGLTMSALSSLAICEEMVAAQPLGGRVDCCASTPADSALRRGLQWLDERRQADSVTTSAKTVAAYYLNGLDRSSMIVDRLFAERDWYRPAARDLLLRRDYETGVWKGNNSIVATSHALSFLAKGLAPVLVVKLRSGPGENRRKGAGLIEDWNRHPGEMTALLRELCRVSGWPRLLSSQEVCLQDLDLQVAAARLSQSPVLLLTGSSAPDFSPAEVEMIGEYVRRGGVVFAVRSCSGGDFERGVRDLAAAIFPEEPLAPLPYGHPIYNSEFALGAEDAVLWGVEAGCRTAFVYCPEDLACLWAALEPEFPEGSSVRSPRRRALEIGMSVISFAAGRNPKDRLAASQSRERQQVPLPGSRPPFIARLRHEGGADVAGFALGNLCRAVEQAIGVPVPTEERSVAWDDPRLFRYPLLFLHGSRAFVPTVADRRKLRQHLDHGGVLIADACCGSPTFDVAFRKFAALLYPKHPLRVIPHGHEIYSGRNGSQIDRVHLRRRVAGQGGIEVIESVPEIEGIEVDGRYVVLYSRWDLSCALDGRGATRCAGYVRDDAVRLAVNLVLYGMLQDLTRAGPDAP